MHQKRKMKIHSINFFIPLFLFLGLQSSAQLLDSTALSQETEYTSLSEALKNPDQVYRLNLRKKKLKIFPQEILTLKNLQELDLGRNKIKEIPAGIGQLTHLELFNVSKNRLDTLPPELGKLVNLKKLVLNQNTIAHLPSEIGNLKKLTVLDLWGNEIQHLPPEIAKLKNTLKLVDLRVISIKEDLQEEMVTLLPNTKFFFSMSCNCN
jgi:Leucine-rich repeat (LRR) protein